MRRISTANVIGLVAIMLLFLVSCAKNEETTNINLGATLDITKTTIEQIKSSFLEPTTKIVTGRVEKVIFQRSNNIDSIVFQDGLVYTCTNAERFVWQIGKIHRIRIICGFGEIEKVQVL